MTTLRACIEGNSRIAFNPLDLHINQPSLSTDSLESSPSRDKQNADIPVRVTSKSLSDLIHQIRPTSKGWHARIICQAN